MVAGAQNEDLDGFELDEDDVARDDHEGEVNVADATTTATRTATEDGEEREATETGARPTDVTESGAEGGDACRDVPERTEASRDIRVLEVHGGGQRRFPVASFLRRKSPRTKFRARIFF